MSAGLHRTILGPSNMEGSVINQAGSSEGGMANYLQDPTVFDTKESGAFTPLRLHFSTVEEMATFIATHPRIRFVDYTFTDPLGQWHHCTFSAEAVDIKAIAEGYGFDASSIPMFERIENSDYVMKPDVTTCWLDPFATIPTLHVSASVFTPAGEPYAKCPRNIVAKALGVLRAKGIADDVFFGPEAEFFLFSSARYSVSPHRMAFSLDGEEAYWNMEAPKDKFANSHGVIMDSANLAHRANIKEGYMTGKPIDKSADVRSEMLMTLQQLGIKTERHHHEVATCQMELNIASRPVLEMADTVQILKYVVKNVAVRHGKTATFMPKPLANDNGSGMHCNQSLWKDGKNLFYDPDAKHQLSEIGRWYMAGILHHCRALLAFCCPTTNSYRRLVPDFEAPVHVTYSIGNRSTAIRVPTFTSERTKRIEFRSPDASMCIYLGFAAMILAGLDGIERKLPLPPQGHGNLFDTSNPEAKAIARLPISLDEAIEALEADHDFLTKDGVFGETFIASFAEYKRKETAALRCCPHPREFMLYYGC